MTHLCYNGKVSEDIKLFKKNSDKRQKIMKNLDLTYLCGLVVYLVFIFVRIANGLGGITSLNIFVNSIIIVRNIIYINMLNTKNKVNESRSKINSLAYDIFHIKMLDNNFVGRLSDKNFEDAIVIKNEEHLKNYDEENDVRSYIDIVTNYIYLLDSEEVLNVLKEVNKTTKENNEDSYTETTLELLSLEDIPDELPVKQVLKLRKDN